MENTGVWRLYRITARLECTAVSRVNNCRASREGLRGFARGRREREGCKEREG